MVGGYVGKIYSEVKARPRYIIEEYRHTRTEETDHHDDFTCGYSEGAHPLF